MHNRFACLGFVWLAILVPCATLGCWTDDNAGAGGREPCNDSTSGSSVVSVGASVVAGATTGNGDTTTSTGSGDGGTMVYPDCEPGVTRLQGKDYNGTISRSIPDSTVDADLLSSLQIDWPDKSFMFFDWIGGLMKDGELASVRGAVRFSVSNQIREIEPGSTIIFFADPTNQFVELANFHIFVYPQTEILGCMRHGP